MVDEHKLYGLEDQERLDDEVCAVGVCTHRRGDRGNA